MKKIYAIITAALLLCGCTQNESVVEETYASESVTKSAVTEKVTTAATKEVAETVTLAGKRYDKNEEKLFLHDIPLTDTDLERLSESNNLTNLSIDLLAEGCEITDLNALSSLDALQVLSINGTYTDMSFLGNMKSLNKICFSHCCCDTFENVPNNTQIMTIDFDESEIADLSWLSNFNNLTELSLNHFTSEDFSSIGELNKLENLSWTFSVVNITDFDFLGNIETLKRLVFNPFPSDKIYDFDAVSKCILLEEICISGTYTNLDFCNALTNLKKFKIIADDDKEYDLSPLLNCGKLEEINLYCKFDELQAEEIEKALTDKK